MRRPLIVPRRVATGHVQHRRPQGRSAMRFFQTSYRQDMDIRDNVQRNWYAAQSGPRVLPFLVPCTWSTSASCSSACRL